MDKGDLTCLRCGELGALKENYRLAEAVARGEESRAKQLESNLNMASGDIKLCHRRIVQLEAALEKVYEYLDHPIYDDHNGIELMRHMLDTALHGTPNG